MLKPKTIEPNLNNLPASYIDVSSGSIIMANGIFLIGAIQQFSFLNYYIGTYLTYFLILIWLYLLFSFFRSLFFSTYRRYVMTNPLTTFGAGTWIASTSVVGNLVINRLPNSSSFANYLLIFNLFMWGIFIILCMKQLKTIIVEGFILETHGVLLLSTVSTQSIACLISNIHASSLFADIISGFIFIGALFYLVSIILLMIRFRSKYRNIHEWKNTDCIIHGAVSITGLSMTVSGNFSFILIITVWYISFCLFILVETFELIRGYMRIKAYGWKNGIFTYHISQWSRNFTFGMFYLFTMRMINKYSPLKQPLDFQSHFIHLLGWIVLSLLVVQVTIYINSRLRKFQRKNLSNTLSV